MGSKLYLSLRFLALVFALGTTAVCGVVLAHDHHALSNLPAMRLEPADELLIYVYTEDDSRHPLEARKVHQALADGKWWVDSMTKPQVNVIDRSSEAFSIDFTFEGVRDVLTRGYRLQTVAEKKTAEHDEAVRAALWSTRSIVDGPEWFVLYLVALAAFIPLGVIEGLRMWVQWLKS